MKLWLRSLVAAALLLAAVPLSAGAATILTVTGGGLNAANVNAICFTGAVGCNGSAAELRLAGEGFVEVGGTITVDGATAIFDLTLVSAVFEQVPLGTGTVSEISFWDVDYDATVPISPTGGGGVSFSQDAGFVTGSAAGVGPAAGFSSVSAVPEVFTDFAVAPIVGNANCGLTAANVGQCSISFGQFFFPITVDGVVHDAIHVFNVDVAPAPEPSTLLLLPLALAALTLRRRTN